MYLSILISSFGFIAFFIWYLASDNAASRRAAGVAVILASLFICGIALWKMPLTLGLDLRGGTEFLLQVQGNPTTQALDQASAVIRKRLDVFGGREITIQPEGQDRLKIQIPGLAGTDVDDVQKTITQSAKLEFRMVPPNSSEIIASAVKDKNGNLQPNYHYATDYEILPLLGEKGADGKEGTSSWIAVKNGPPAISGEHLQSASRAMGQLGQPEVRFQLDNEGAALMLDLCKNYHGQQMAIILDNVVRSAPSLPQSEDDYIKTGSGEIHGAYMTALDCEELASVMQNPLQNPVIVLSRSSVAASLGQDSINSGLHAGVIALLLVVSFMACYYLLSGLIAVLALTVNLVLLFGLLVQFHFTLTLPGIAGIVLTIGMAVDANVLIYERIRDELALGKPARAAIDTGFEKAFSAIFDSNVTTLIPAIVLAYLGTGPLRGFAVTLVLGIVANLFTALIVSRNAFDWILVCTEKPNLFMFQFIKSPRFDFLKMRGFGVILSLVLLIAGAVAVSVQRDSLLGVDFRGGDAVTLTYKEKVDISNLRTVLINGGVKDASFQYRDVSSGVPDLQVETATGQGTQAAQLLVSTFPQAGFSPGSVEEVGSQVGSEMQQKAITALLLGLFGILIYAAIRFEWSYAVAAAVGQLHDVLIALSIMALLGRELTLPLVGALLTIAGYSINDKIVVFDRIREGTHMREKGSFYEVINRSLNLTLARTILTGSTCLLATGALIVFGGPVIHDFALTMFVGIMSGIYSSHFISPGIAYLLGRNGPVTPTPALTSKIPAKKSPAVA